jgi:hypothetical protein
MTGRQKTAGPTNSDLIWSIETVQALGTGHGLRKRISGLEQTLAGKTREEATALVDADGITSEALLAALMIKAIAGQIKVIVHALGILLSLPYLLEQGRSSKVCRLVPVTLVETTISKPTSGSRNSSSLPGVMGPTPFGRMVYFSISLTSLAVTPRSGENFMCWVSASLTAF